MLAFALQLLIQEATRKARGAGVIGRTQGGLSSSRYEEERALAYPFHRCHPSFQGKFLDLKEHLPGREAASNTDPLARVGDAQKALLSSASLPVRIIHG